MYNKLLERQLKRYMKNAPVIPEQFNALLSAISDSYDHYESDRSLLERSLEVSSGELNLANSKVREALAIIEAKNKNILDSINYALRIQQAILPSEEEIRRSLPDSFIFYRPKDVVSGDFYWFGEQDGKKLIAAVDCTGHGVPGAFMSMIGSALLNEIVNERSITEPGSILDSLRENIIRSMKQTGAEGENKDGMDIALCVLDSSGIRFAGANNPLWLIRDGELIELKGDKQPIGIHTVSKSFQTTQMELKKDDCLYVFTDGYADQFGGGQGKKFKYKQLAQLLISGCRKSMQEQRQLLEKAFDSWKGSFEQIDDVLVMGIKV
jgi:serine phosphatase RsbU (regulator of sigma subunit)